LVAETFTTAFWVRERFDLDQSDARPWLFGIATNVFRHYWRSESRRIRREAITPIEQPSDDPAEEASANVFFQSHSEPIARALAQLDQPSVEVLLLIAGPGFTYEEVATALDIPVGTVRSRLARARRKLRELLDESGQYLDDGEPSNQPISTTEGPT
jgi:RNA polymerase sigma-70 factor (ECF subfamily)